jgi:hypothetical protein
VGRRSDAGAAVCRFVVAFAAEWTEIVARILEKMVHLDEILNEF